MGLFHRPSSSERVFPAVLLWTAIWLVLNIPTAVLIWPSLIRSCLHAWALVRSHLYTQRATLEGNGPKDILKSLKLFSTYYIFGVVENSSEASNLYIFTLSFMQKWCIYICFSFVWVLGLKSRENAYLPRMMKNTCRSSFDTKKGWPSWIFFLSIPSSLSLFEMPSTLKSVYRISVVMLLFYLHCYSLLLFGSTHANAVLNEQKKPLREGGIREIETISLPLNNQKSSTLPFFVLVFGFCVCFCVCVCVVCWWVGRGIGAVMCLTDIEDNCPLSSSCLCNSTAAATWATLTWAGEEGKDPGGSYKNVGVGMFVKRKKAHTPLNAVCKNLFYSLRGAISVTLLL